MRITRLTEAAHARAVEAAIADAAKATIQQFSPAEARQCEAILGPAMLKSAARGKTFAQKDKPRNPVKSIFPGIIMTYLRTHGEGTARQIADATGHHIAVISRNCSALAKRGELDREKVKTHVSEFIYRMGAAQ